MPAVTTDDYGIVRTALGNAEIKSAAIAKLYLASNNAWCNTGLVGAVAVCGDPNKKSYFLRLVDLRSRSVVWEQEFYQGFIYQVSAPFFHTFETDHTVGGLSFADEGEAKEFFNKVLYCKNSPYMTAEQKVQAKQNIIQAEKTVRQESGKGGEKKKKKNPFDFVTKLFKKEEPGANFSLSGPTNFRHQSHIGWDPDKGFEINNIPPEWKQLFAAAGVKKSELKDAATAKYVMNVITDAMLADSGMGAPTPQPTAPSQPVAVTAPPPPPQPQQPQQHYTPPPPPQPQQPYNPPQPTHVSQPEPHYETPVEESTGGSVPPPPPPPVAPTPPPPPTPGVAPPPPNPSVPRTTSNLPPVGDDRGSLLDAIRQGTSLKSVASTDAPVDLKNVSSEKKKTLADTLAAAMAARRQDLDIDAHAHGGGHAEDDEEWSV